MNNITLTASLLGAAQRTTTARASAMVEEGVTLRQSFVDPAIAAEKMLRNMRFLERAGTSQADINNMMRSLARTAAVLEVAGHNQLAIEGIAPVLTQHYEGNPAQLMIEALIEVAQDAGARGARGYRAQVAEALAARLIKASDTSKGDGWGLNMPRRLTQRAMNEVRDSASLVSLRRVSGIYAHRINSASADAIQSYVARVESGEIFDVRGMNSGFSRFARAGVQSNAALVRAAQASHTYLTGLVEAVQTSRTAGVETVQIDGGAVSARGVNLAQLKRRAKAYETLSAQLAKAGADQSAEAERVRTSYAALQSVRRAEYARRSEPARARGK